MKKIVRIFSLVMVLALLFSAMPMAMADTTKFEVEKCVEGISYESNDLGLVTLTYSGTGKFTVGDYYAIFVIKGTKDNYAMITEDNPEDLIYINQVQAESSDSITFEKVYLKEMTDCVIIITGAGLDGGVVATIDMNYLLGDVDLDGFITAADAACVLRMVAGEVEGWQSIQWEAANVDGDANVTASDAAAILRYVAGSGSFEG